MCEKKHFRLNIYESDGALYNDSGMRHRNRSRANRLSSAGQLPVPTALDAAVSTLSWFRKNLSANQIIAYSLLFCKYLYAYRENFISVRSEAVIPSVLLHICGFFLPFICFPMFCNFQSAAKNAVSVKTQRCHIFTFRLPRCPYSAKASD